MPLVNEWANAEDLSTELKQQDYWWVTDDWWQTMYGKIPKFQIYWGHL